MIKERKSSQILLGIILAFTFLSEAVVFTLNFRPLYEWDMKNYNLEESTGISAETIMKQYDTLIAYNRIGGPDTLSFPDLTASETGLFHFAEVKQLFLFFQWGLILGILFSAAGIFYFRKKSKLYLEVAGLISLIAPVIVGILALLFWDYFFVAFHKIFFRNNYWLFDETTDPIILLLPDGFFLHCAMLIVGLFLAGGAISMVLYKSKILTSRDTEG